MYNYQYIRIAKRLESEHEWFEASRMWRKIGWTADADACALIASSIEKGDAYRMDCAEVAGRFLLGLITNSEYHREIGEIYKHHFKMKDEPKFE